MENGWICLHRKIRDHWLWNDPEKLKWWFDILLQVNHSEKSVKVNLGLKIIECGRGQTIMSLNNWAERWNVSRDCARHFLHLLQNDDMIKMENVKKSTRITVCNYDTYNLPAHARQTDDKQMTNRRLTDGDTNNNGLITNNNGKNVKTPKEGNSNFLESLIFLFKEAFEEINGIPYAINQKKDFPAAAELVNVIKAETGINEEEELTRYLQGYFKQVINHPDNFYKTRMTLPFLANNFNMINNIYKSKSGTFSKSEWERILQPIISKPDPKPPTAEPAEEYNPRPVMPALSEVTEFFVSNGYRRDAADNFHFSLERAENREKIILVWKEFAKQRYFNEKNKI